PADDLRRARRHRTRARARPAASQAHRPRRIARRAGAADGKRVVAVERRFVFFVAASAVFMTALLLIDRNGPAQQLALGAATAAFLWLFVRRSGIDGRQVVVCILVATTGEIVLSLGWGLYSYAHDVIPFYVPPGHGLVY